MDSKPKKKQESQDSTTTPSKTIKGFLNIPDVDFTAQELSRLKSLGFNLVNPSVVRYENGGHFQIRVEKSLHSKPSPYEYAVTPDPTKVSKFIYYHVQVIDRDNKGKNQGQAFQARSFEWLLETMELKIAYGNR
jgi:hypothetical protein